MKSDYRTPLDPNRPTMPSTAMPEETDDEIEARLATMTDKQVCAIYMHALDPENLSREEELALGECERRGVDF